MQLAHVLVLALGLALGPAAVLRAEAPKTAREIQDCVEGNLPEKSSIQGIVFRAHDRIGAINESRAKIFWQRAEDDRSRVLIEFSEPYDLLGAKVLLLDRKQAGQRDMFMYLPELKKVKRITSRMVSGSMFGTDFTYEDFEMIQDYAPKAKASRLADAEVDGAPAWVVESRPDPEEVSGYERIVDYVDPKTCVRLKTELHEDGDRLRKVMTADRARLQQADGLWYSPQILLRDLMDETHTELLIEEVEVGAKISRKLFSQANLTQGR